MTSSGAAFAAREYNLRAAFPDHPQWFARWAHDAERPRGALLFIHGGYWRALDKDDHSFIAPSFVAEGIGVAVVNYDLCPGVRIAHIVEQCRQAVDWLTREGESHGVPARRLIVGGHSAGGHL